MISEVLPRQTARDFLSAHESRRQVNRVLHGFPSPRFWQTDAVSVPAAL
jgi:hypothetical protein